MSRIDELIQQYCPNGVAFVGLGDIGHYSDTRIGAALVDETTFVGVDNLLSDKRGRVDATYSPNAAALAAYAVGDVLIGNIRPYLKKVWLADRVGGCSGDVLCIRVHPECAARVEPKFLFYVLSSDEFFAFNNRHAKGAKMPRGSKAAILKYQFQLPPVEVQREIVRVLDLFQSLEAELEAELEARRKQYEHYRDSLLSFPESGGVRWIRLGELGAIYRGRRFTKADYAGHGIPAIHYGELYTHYGIAAADAVTHVRPEIAPRLRFAQPGDVVISEVGETVEDVGKGTAWLGDREVAIHDGCFGFSHSQDPKFIAYLLQAPAFQAAKRRHVARAKVKRLSLEGLKAIRVPVPEIREQRRIVAILDRFDALVNDLSSGLPAELRARRAQYEYYRDRLLTFDEVAA